MADGSGKPRYENLKTRRARIRTEYLQRSVRCVGGNSNLFCIFFAMNKYKSTQHRYCCVPLCNQKGSKGPNGEKVGFFSIPTDKYLREQWLHAIRRDTVKHFTNTNSTKVCYLHLRMMSEFCSQTRSTCKFST